MSQARRTSTSARLPPMGAGGGPPLVGGISMGLPKLASFDWPPPPSPAHALSRGSPGCTPGAVVGTSGSRMDDVARKLLQDRRSSRVAEVRARAELWTLRDEIDRDVLREVAPYPFFGQPMRFQDETSALQITEDGRFSFSTMAAEGEVSDFAGGMDAGPRAVLTYEGVLCTPPLDDPMLEAVKGDDEVAIIEGRAIVRHEIHEEEGRTRIVSVDRGQFRFAITVSPFFQPTSATVQAQERPSSPGRPPPRCRRLQWVGKGRTRCRNLNEDLPQPRRGFTLKFSSSAGGLSVTKGKETGFMPSPASPSTGAFDQTSLPRLNCSSSAPQLKSPCTPGKSKNGHKVMSVADWKEFYQQRADSMLARERRTG